MKRFADQLRSTPRGWAPGAIPAWVPAFTDFCLKQVPHYRRQGGSADRFLEVPTFTREDLARRPWDFVPDGQPLDGLIVYPTSGTTGHPADVLADPETFAKNLP